MQSWVSISEKGRSEVSKATQRLSIGILFLLGPGCMVSMCQAQQNIQLIGTVSIPGDARDLSGETETLENGEAVNRLGGFSAIDYAGTGSLYALLSDRGPDDGAVSYPCRVQLAEILTDPGAAEPVKFQLKATVPLVDSEKRPFTGRSSFLVAEGRFAHRLDPEGVRFGADQTLYVSDEYGPEILQFDRQGKELRRLSLPAWLKVEHPSGDRQEENAKNKAGRASNRGMEGLAISTDGGSLVGLMQGPLIQDGKKSSDNTKVIGLSCRLLKIAIATGQTEEYVYELDSEKNGNSEILAMPDGRYLVLERDSGAGNDAKHRRLIAIDLRGATNIYGRKSLKAEGQQGSIQPVSKSVYLDLLDPAWKLAGESMPEKIEGVTFGPVLNDGRRTLLVSTDNDFESSAASRIWVFAVSE